MNFEFEYIEKLANLADEKQLTELTIEDDNKAIIIKRGGVATSATVTTVAPQVTAAPAPVTTQAEAPAAEQSKGTAITSPMVGAFYAAPSPGAKPFVKVGDTVAAGQVVCDNFRFNWLKFFSKIYNVGKCVIWIVDFV